MPQIFTALCFVLNYFSYLSLIIISYSFKGLIALPGKRADGCRRRRDGGDDCPWYDILGLYKRNDDQTSEGTDGEKLKVLLGDSDDDDSSELNAIGKDVVEKWLTPTVMDSMKQLHAPPPPGEGARSAKMWRGQGSGSTGYGMKNDASYSYESGRRLR